MNRKAVFFTILAIALLSLFLVSYTFLSFIESRDAINKRIKTMNNFVFSIEQDLPRQLYVSGFRMILLLDREVHNKHVFVADINSSINELFYNGTLNGENQKLMKRANFSGIQETLNEKANKINANIELSNPSLSFGQDDPWHVKFTLTLDVSIEDNTDLVSWNKTSTISSLVPIETFFDPVYAVYAPQIIPNYTFNQTIYPLPLGGNLPSQVNNHFYINTTISPSFLKRLQGDLSADPNGIESLVGKSVPDMPQYDKSIVDYIYFGPTNPQPTQNIMGYEIDAAHVPFYGS